MSLLENLPDRCSIITREQNIDLDANPLGGNMEVENVVSANVECWMQPASNSEIMSYGKRNLSVTHKIFFHQDPGVSENYMIRVTERSGLVLANPISFVVQSFGDPDASAGLSVLWRVMVQDDTGAR